MTCRRVTVEEFLNLPQGTKGYDQPQECENTRILCNECCRSVDGCFYCSENILYNEPSCGAFSLNPENDRMGYPYTNEDGTTQWFYSTQEMCDSGLFGGTGYVFLGKCSNQCEHSPCECPGGASYCRDGWTTVDPCVCGSPLNYASLIDWSQWNILVDGAPAQGYYDAIINPPCLTAYAIPDNNTELRFANSTEPVRCTDGNVYTSVTKTVLTVGTSEELHVLVQYCQWNVFITADETLTPSVSRITEGQIHNCPVTPPAGQVAAQCCGDTGGPCTTPNITFQHV